MTSVTARSVLPGTPVGLSPSSGALILVVEDDPSVAEVVGRYLEREGFIVAGAVDGPAAVRHAAADAPELVLLDLSLPGFDGLEVLRRLRATSRVPVVILTARGEESDRVQGLELGADDYLPKPFAFAELVARVRALGRRAQAPRPPVLNRGDIVLDPSRRVVTRAGRLVSLTKKELAVLEVLMAADGAVVSAEELLERRGTNMPTPSPTPSGSRSRT